MKKVLQLLTLTTLLATSLSAAPIHDAVRAGNLDMVKQMIEENSTLVNAQDERGRTPLHFAASTGHTEIVRFLLAYRANVNARANINNTPLHDAAYGGHTEIVRLLLARGVKVNAENILGCTPLHGAVIGGNTAVVELLLVYGADVNTQASFTNETPLDAARRHNHTAIIELFAIIPLLQSLRNLSDSEIITVQ